MKKSDVLKYFGGVSATAKAMGITPAAVSVWPETLSKTVANRVNICSNGGIENGGAWPSGRIGYPVIITISGNVSSGKSPWANKIRQKAEQNDLDVFFSDSIIFENDKSKDIKYKKTISEAKKRKCDLAIITVGTANEHNELIIKITPALAGYSAQVLNLLG
jgi:hypothetical protein